MSIEFIGDERLIADVGVVVVVDEKRLLGIGDCGRKIVSPEMTPGGM